MKKKKISFCTVCMNRTSFLKQTLPKNIEYNLAYGNIEFVILNYNSTDGMHEWITKEMSHHIDSGLIRYVRTLEPQYFRWSHSKNVVALQASGEIICNLDADNFTGQGFATYINNQFQKNEQIFLAVDKGSTIRDCYGRICAKKSDFLKVRGYDEAMDFYGYEDFDLMYRLELSGVKKERIENKKFLKAVLHSNEERLINRFNNTVIQKIYIRYETLSISTLLFLFGNGSAYLGKVIENRTVNAKSIENLFPENRNHEYTYELLDNKWDSGTHSLQEGVFINGQALEISEGYYEISNREIFFSMTMFYSQITNRVRMEQNKANKLWRVNHETFGEVKIEKIGLGDSTVHL
ncbi:glycosyltransferase family 2 protein [Ulvibacterium sp.]|uniref:glycosyltransferase family 2 protein n=1 Tax=Ulvibacterium sp. TaxID=2665914 RepID=UPI003BA90997